MTPPKVVASSLKELGIDTVFGIPGIHNLDLYDAFTSNDFRSVTATHEQGAAFMADGYARVLGRPAVCLTIDGPGLLNAATAIAQAKNDSSPMVVVTPEMPSTPGINGKLHEFDNQYSLGDSLARSSLHIDSRTCAISLIKRLNHHFRSTRPGPIVLFVSSGINNTPYESVSSQGGAHNSPSRADRVSIAQRVLNAARYPMVVLGGGARDIGPLASSIVENLDAPCINTVNGKGLLPLGHPLRVGLSPSLSCVRHALTYADAVLAVGTEFAETDYDFFQLGPLPQLKGLVRIDIDPDQISKNQVPAVELIGDAKAILNQLDLEPKERLGRERSHELVQQGKQEQHRHADFAAFLEALSQHTDYLIGDSCQPTYHATWDYEPASPRGYSHSASGFGTLGFAIPAALGAKVARPEDRVTALIGDGASLFTISEFATASKLGLPLPIVLWDNNGYREIEKASKVRDGAYRCVQSHRVDFQLLAAGFHTRYVRVRNLDDLTSELHSAHSVAGPTLLHAVESDFIKLPQSNWY